MKVKVGIQPKSTLETLMAFLCGGGGAHFTKHWYCSYYDFIHKAYIFETQQMNRCERFQSGETHRHKDC